MMMFRIEIWSKKAPPPGVRKAPTPEKNLRGHWPHVSKKGVQKPAPLISESAQNKEYPKFPTTSPLGRKEGDDKMIGRH